MTECLTCEKDLRDMGEGELVDLLEDDVVIHDLAEVRLAGSYSYDLIMNIKSRDTVRTL